MHQVSLVIVTLLEWNVNNILWTLTGSNKAPIVVGGRVEAGQQDHREVCWDSLGPDHGGQDQNEDPRRGS